MTMTENPTYTADVVLLAPDTDGRWHVLLIERAFDPFAGQLALPGGKAKPGESTLVAAGRELREETGLTAPVLLLHVGRYDAPGRDPRGPFVSDAYVAVLDHLCRPSAGDDARAARWVPLADVVSNGEVAFDHLRIITDAVGVMTAADPNFQTATEH